MSYIRSLSNPEGLYIIASISKKAEFFLPNKVEALHMPLEVFEGLLKKYVSQECEPASSEGNEIYLHEGASLKFLAPPEQVAAYGRSSGADWKWFLHYEGWEQPIEMWEVTLDSIAQDVRRQYIHEDIFASMKENFECMEQIIQQQEAETPAPTEALKLFKAWFEGNL